MDTGVLHFAWQPVRGLDFVEFEERDFTVTV